MTIDFIAHLRRHVDPVPTAEGCLPVRLVAFDQGQRAFREIFELIREVELPPDGWTPVGGWSFLLWDQRLSLAISADAHGALLAITNALKLAPPFRPDGFMLWIDHRLFQVDLQSPRLSGRPLELRDVADLTPISNRRQTFGQQIITEMQQIRESWAHGRVEECRTRMGLIKSAYEAFIRNPDMIAGLCTIERIDLEAGALAFRKAFDDLQPAWNQRPPQWT